MSEPFYHLRPNKYIDRCLFVNCLKTLSRTVDFSDHRYIGFGSYYFDDFRQIHDQLNITEMISLEMKEKTYNRALFNKPYKCIKIINESSTDFIAGDDWEEKKNIIWFDYSFSKELGSQFSDIASLSKLLGANDIIRVTLNANPSALGSKEEEIKEIKEIRFEKLKQIIGDYIPAEITASDIESKKYPLALLKCLKKLLQEQFEETIYAKRFLLPLFSTIYNDGQNMLTFTGLVLDDHELEKKVIKLCKKENYINLNWCKPYNINIPELTAKEVIEMNKLLPLKNGSGKQLLNKFNFVLTSDTIKSYMDFYKYYPKFHNVSF